MDDNIYMLLPLFIEHLSGELPATTYSEMLSSYEYGNR